jgi:hypothetical protein
VPSDQLVTLALGEPIAPDRAGLELIVTHRRLTEDEAVATQRVEQTVRGGPSHRGRSLPRDAPIDHAITFLPGCPGSQGLSGHRP